MRSSLSFSTTSTQKHVNSSTDALTSTAAGASGPVKLPRLPVPDLRKTLDRYLASLCPFLLEDEARGEAKFSDAYALRVKWADEFEKGIGGVLQERLKALDRASPHNWLDDNFWLKKAYLEQRAPLLINSNWWLAFHDDPDLTSSASSPPTVASGASEETANGVERDLGTESGEITGVQIRRATSLLWHTLDFKLKLDAQEIHPDTTRTGVWFRDSARHMFSICRIPQLGRDALSSPPKPSSPDARKVLVMVHGWCYGLTVLRSATKLVDASEVESGLWAIVRDANGRKQAGEEPLDIGALSADERDRWAANLTHLLTLSPYNSSTYTTIQHSLLALSLDAHSSSTLDERLHAVRTIPQNLANRFFDKTTTIIVDPASHAGMMGEHSPTDALVPSIVAEYVVAQGVDPSSEDRKDVSGLWERLDWISDSHIVEESDAARKRALTIIANSDNSVLWFKGYGADWIKDTAKLSPDAYLQMVLQLAWYRTHGSLTATYETALTRMFHRGRTETIRTVTTDSWAFVPTMLDASASADQKAQALRKAISTHVQLTREAATGRGIDRHLMGLRLLLKPEEGEHAELFGDPLFSRTADWKLSTSGLSAGHYFCGTGFCAVSEDGYGINYLAAPDLIKFGVESKHSSPLTSTSIFKTAIVDSLLEMRQVILDSSNSFESHQSSTHL